MYLTCIVHILMFVQFAGTCTCLGMIKWCEAKREVLVCTSSRPPRCSIGKYLEIFGKFWRQNLQDHPGVAVGNNWEILGGNGNMQKYLEDLNAKNNLQAVIIATYSEPVVPEQVRKLHP